jgi:hypothetical protein
MTLTDRLLCHALHADQKLKPSPPYRTIAALLREAAAELKK